MFYFALNTQWFSCKVIWESKLSIQLLYYLMRKSYCKRLLIFSCACTKPPKISHSIPVVLCSLYLTPQKKRERENKQDCQKCFSCPLGGIYRKAIQVKCGVPPISWTKQGLKQSVCLSATNGGDCTVPDVTTEWSHRLCAAVAVKNQSIQSENIHRLHYGTGCLSQIRWEKQIYSFAKTEHLHFLFTYIESLTLLFPHGVTHK